MTGMGDVKGKMYVSDEDYPTFLDYLEEYLFQIRGVPCSLVEQRRTDGATPLLVDLDFRYEQEKALKRAFTKEHIEAFVHSLLDVLQECCDLKATKSLRFFVTLRGEPYLDNKRGTRGSVKDGIHIVCPDVTLTPELQKAVRLLILEREGVAKAFEGTGYVNKDEDVFDESLTKKNGWFFYGDSKPLIPAYKLEHVFRWNQRSGKVAEESKDAYTTKQLMRLLSIRFEIPEPIAVKEGFAEKLKELLADIHQAPAEQDKEKEKDNHDEQEVTVVSAWQPWLETATPESEIQLAGELVNKCLKAERAEGYESWMRVGWCLRNIEASEEMFALWMNFSSKSPKFSQNNVDALRRDWLRGSMRRIGDSKLLTIRSLHKWAREDNPEAYKEILKNDICNYIKKVGIAYKGGTHHHVASIVHKLFSDRYRCSVENRATEWYEFKDHVWRIVPQAIDLKLRLHTEVAEHVCAARLTIPKDGKTDDEIKKYSEYMLKLCEMEKNLYNANFKDSVIKECVQLFYDDEFHKKMNQSPYLLGCANGVLNLREPILNDKGEPVKYKAILRPGIPTDYISYQLGHSEPDMEAIHYDPYDPADPKQLELKEFFEKLFPDSELREYVLTLSAGCLEAANVEQAFYILTGSGGNGKTKYTDLMRMTLGDYLSSLATTALTRKRPESGAANPDMISIKGRRCIIMQEPDEREPINTARMKQLSGEDIVEARGLFKDQERFKITGKFFMCCNRLPPINSMDGGTWRRLKVIPFNSRFVPPGDPSLDPANHIYPRDPMLDEKIKGWREAFLALLVHYYETRYCPNGITKVPDIVNQQSANYKNSNDAFEKFLSARVRFANKYACIAGETCTKTAFLKAIANWKKTSGSQLSEAEAKIRMAERFREPADGKTYQHMRLYSADEDAEEFDQTDCGEETCKGHVPLRVQSEAS